MASYRFGVMWIALNDEPMEMDPDVVRTFISTALLADLFGKETEAVAADIVKYKLRNADEREKTDRQLNAIEKSRFVWFCGSCKHREPVANTGSGEAGDQYKLGDSEPCVHCSHGTCTVIDSRVHQASSTYKEAREWLARGAR